MKDLSIEVTYLKMIFFFVREITLEPRELQLRNTNSREANWKRLTVSVCSSHRLGAEQQDHLGTY